LTRLLPEGGADPATMLAANGYSRKLVHKYVLGGWLTSFARYYGHYSNKSRGMRKKAGSDDQVTALVESAGCSSSFPRNQVSIFFLNPFRQYVTCLPSFRRRIFISRPYKFYSAISDRDRFLALQYYGNLSSLVAGIINCLALKPRSHCNLIWARSCACL
jgi:hypothetical protein